MKQKRIAIIALTLVIIAIISGCGNDSGSGLNYGFNGRGEFLDGIMTGVKSAEKDFSIDDITLDFYYGSVGGLNDRYHDYQNIKPIGIGVYFANAKDLEPIYNDDNFQVEDYTDIYGLNFVEFIEMDKYNSDEYNVKLSAFKTRFNHKETLTVPTNVIKQDAVYKWSEMYFCLVLIRIVHLANGVYSRDYLNCLSIQYEFIDENTVHLSNPGGLFQELRQLPKFIR